MNNNIPVSGQQLLADFQSVLLSLATAQAAVQEAERSESELMHQLSEASQGRYLQPASLGQMDGDYVVRASLDAHIKKVQAQQLQSLSAAQLENLISDDRQAYKGKKVRITVVDGAFQPFDAVWFDQQKGYRTSTYKKKFIEGHIEELGFEKNMLIIRPKRLLRLINSNLQLYIAYVINPETLKPAVDISLL